MGIVLLVIFAVLEIVLAVLTCTTFRQKHQWHKNKLFVRLAEVILLALVLLLPTGQKWRFAVCLGLMGLRLACSGLACALSSAKAAKGVVKEKRKAGAIFHIVCSLLITTIALAPAFVFTGYKGLPASGDLKVRETSAILVDSSRLDPWEENSQREVPIHFYYPESGAENCPFVLFAHGSFGYYQSNSSLYEELASNGYVVASIDHPHYAFFTEDTDGQTILVDTQFMQDAMNVQNEAISIGDAASMIEEWVEVRSADENFALDSVKAAKAADSLSDAWFTASDETAEEILHVLRITDTEKIGLTGHSIGGAMGIKLGRERDDIDAVVVIDGTMLSERMGGEDGASYVEEPYPVPFLDLSNDENYDAIYNPDYTDEKGRPYINYYVLNNAVDGRSLRFENSAHMDFTDLPLLSPTLAKMLGSGTVDAKEMLPEMNKVIRNYFDYYLKGEGELMVSAWEGC